MINFYLFKFQLFRVVHIVIEVIAEIEIVDDAFEAHEMTKIRVAIALISDQVPKLKQNQITTATAAAAFHQIK